MAIQIIAIIFNSALERPATKRACYDENEEVEVDVDDAKNYGDPQYPLFTKHSSVTKAHFILFVFIFITC